MSIFGTIMSKVFGHAGAPTPGPAGAAPSAQAATQTTNTGAGASGSAPPVVPSAPSPDTTGSTSTSTATPATGGGPASAGPAVDVAAVLDGMGSHAGQKLDWRHSIVDLMKLLDMDSSLSARKELAHELHYTGSTDDSAAMNIWLHKEVMTKFAANGGKLPSDLQH